MGVHCAMSAGLRIHIIIHLIPQVSVTDNVRVIFSLLSSLFDALFFSLLASIRVSAEEKLCLSNVRLYTIYIIIAYYKS